MQKIDDIWLTERGGLHDAKLLSVHSSDQAIEISISDEWVNERGLSLSNGEKAPGSLLLENASVIQGALDDANGGWILDVKIHGTIIYFEFCDRAPLALQASAINWRSDHATTREA